MGLLDNFFRKKVDKIYNVVSDKKIFTNFISKNYFNDIYYNYLDDNTDYDINYKLSDINAMYRDPIINNAVRLLVDDATNMSNITNKRLWVVINNSDVYNVVNDFLNFINVNVIIQYIARNVVLYGNCFVRLYYKSEINNSFNNDEFFGGIEFLEIEQDMFRYIPIELNNILIGWYDRYKNAVLRPYQVVLFKNWEVNIFAGFDKYFKVNAEYNLNSEKENKDNIILKNTFQYGVGFFENCRRIWRQLKLIEDSIIMQRVEMGRITRFVKVKVPDNADVDTINTLVMNYANMLSSTENFNKDNSTYRNKYTPISGNNIVIPVTDSQDVSIETFGGDSELGSIADLEYFRTKFYSALGVPPAYLGLTDDIPSSLGENALVRLEIRYARAVKRLQGILISGFKNIIFYHLLSLNYNIDYDSFDVVMNMISTAEDENYKSALDKSLGIINSFLDVYNVLRQLKAETTLDDEQFDLIVDFISKQILNVSDLDFDMLFRDVVKANVGNSEEEGGSNLFGGEEEGGSNLFGSEEETGEEEIFGSEEETGEEEIFGSEQKKNFIHSNRIKSKKPSLSNNRRVALRNNKIPVITFNKKPDDIINKFPEEKKKKFLEAIDILKKYNKLDYIFGLMNRIMVKKDGSVKYIEEEFKNKKSKFLFEVKKYDKFVVNEFRNIIKDLYSFDISIFSLNVEDFKLDVKSDVSFLKETNKLDINLLTFCERMYKVDDIMNYKGKDNDKIYIYKNGDKLYINYVESLKLFKNIIENKKYKFYIYNVKAG